MKGVEFFFPEKDTAVRMVQLGYLDAHEVPARGRIFFFFPKIFSQDIFKKI